MKNEQTIKSILDWFALAKPNPTKENVLQQTAYHFEEAAEMCEALKLTNTAREIKSVKQGLLTYADTQDCDYFTSQIDKVALLDALCDQIVTALGVGYMLGFDMQGALAEVNRSNWSKFENGKPIFNEHGKIMKGENYSTPALDKYLGEDDENV